MEYPSTKTSEIKLIIEEICMAGLFYDAVIEVEDVKFSIHRIILSQCSSFFRNFFESYPEQRTFRLTNTSPEIIQLIINFAYTGSVPVTVYNVQDLMLKANWLNVKGIIQICSNFLATELRPNNCISIMHFINVCNSDLQLWSTAFHYITTHFEEVIPYEEFLDLSVDELTEILGRDDLNVKTERIVFDAILRWISSNPDERQQHLPVLLSKARLALTNTDYIKADVMSNKLVKSNSQCLKIVSHNLKTLWQMSRCVAWQKVFFNPFGRPRLPQAILLAIGGLHQNRSTGQVNAYDSIANQWKTFAKNLECPRAFHGTAFLSGYVYCIGGFTGDARQGTYLNTVSRLDLRRLIWMDVANMYCCRSNVTVTVLQGLIYALGGNDGFGRLKSAECYNPKTNQWTRIPSMNQQRSAASCTTLHNKIYICGGFTGHDVLRTAEFYNPGTSQWTMIVPMNSARTGLAVTTFHNRIYAAGGIEVNARLQTTEVFDPQTNTWSLMPNMITPRSSFCLEVIEDRIYAIGGKDTWSTLPNFEYYDTKANIWSQDISTFPSLRGVGCCVVCGIPNLVDFTFSRDTLQYLEFNNSDGDTIAHWLQHT